MPSKLARNPKLDVRRTVVVVDTETTGLGHMGDFPRPDAVVQVGYAHRDSKGRVQRWAQFCNPGAEFLAHGRASEAFRVNGLTLNQVLRAPPAREVAKVFHRRLRAVEAETGRPIVLRSYNRDFDEPFLRVAPWNVPSEWWGPCIMKQAANHVNGLGGRWMKLGVAVDRLGLQWPSGQAHTAAVDAHAALLIHEALAPRR